MAKFIRQLIAIGVLVHLLGPPVCLAHGGLDQCTETDFHSQTEETHSFDEVSHQHDWEACSCRDRTTVIWSQWEMRDISINEAAGYAASVDMVQRQLCPIQNRRFIESPHLLTHHLRVLAFVRLLI